jgi:MATE family multidrug resistance protein
MAYIHCGTPSSLPTDYAILSHYASARANEHTHDFYDQNEPTDTQDDVKPDKRLSRRSSFPPPHSRPIKPNLSGPFLSKGFVPVTDEYTPLLIPRIEEEVDPSVDPIHPPSTTKVYLDEFRILFKYTLPVLRQA